MGGQRILRTKCMVSDPAKAKDVKDKGSDSTPFSNICIGKNKSFSENFPQNMVGKAKDVEDEAKGYGSDMRASKTPTNTFPNIRTTITRKKLLSESRSQKLLSESIEQKNGLKS